MHVPPSAALMIVAAVACFSVTEATAKYLTATYPVMLLVWARYVVQAASLALWFGPQIGTRLVRTPRFRLQLLRSLILVSSSVCFFTALKGLPLADATAINYSTPVVVVLIAVVFLKEKMTPSRWAFVVAGFIGMLLIVRPGASILHGSAGFGIAAAGLYAVFQILTRTLSREDPRTTLFYPALCGTVLLTPFVPVLADSLALPWRHLGLIAVMGAFGTCGHFLFIRAFARAPASALTPFSYTQLVWSVLLGWLVFGQFPDRITLAGIGVIAGSGLLLAWHERRQALLAAVARGPTAVD